VPVNSFNYIGPNTIPKINSNIGYSDINKTYNSNHKDDLDNHNNNNNLNHNNSHMNNLNDMDINQINENNNFINGNKNKNINQSYQKKKKEIYNLKEQIGRVKDEINNLMLNSNNPDYNISDNFLAPQRETNIGTNGNLNNGIISKNNINNNALMKKIEDLKAELNKEKNKNIGLEKEVASLKQYLENLNNDLVQQQYNNPQPINKNIFTPKFFIKMFYNINPKIFSSSELKKYYKIYNTQNLNTIFEIFSKTCELLKRQIYESHFEVDTMNTDIDENYISSRNIVIDTSYRLVNERILKLKKLEFDFINLSEFVKNYLVSQEIIVKIIFSSDDNVIQFEPIERLFNLFEDCLNFKIDEMNDNIIFHRKLLIKILKNQKNCLGLSLESIAQQ
jgi:hypothetical protein